MTPTQPAYCPTGQAGPLATRLPRHCAGCRSYVPLLECAWPAWSDHYRGILAETFVRNLGYTLEYAVTRVAAMEAGIASGPVQLVLL